MSNGDSDKNSAMIAYVCYLVGILVPLGSIAGVIINHVKRGDCRGSWIESHHRWMMRTFWYSFLWGMILLALMAVPFVNFIAWFVFIGVFIWYIYRVIRGFLAFNDERPMYRKADTAPPQTEAAGA